jgi:hypothetical protein
LLPHQAPAIFAALWREDQPTEPTASSNVGVGEED